VKKMRTISKDLRKRATVSENRLWSFLKDRQLDGVKFRRQEPIGRYIADFLSYERKLIIELDGSPHLEIENQEQDKERGEWLKSQGYTILRFWNRQVIRNMEGVLAEIRRRTNRPSPRSSPARGEDEGKRNGERMKENGMGDREIY